MGFFDKAKQLLGLGAGKDEPDDEPAADKPSPGHAGKRDRKDRPPLAEVPPSHGRTVEDALAAREAGDAAEARKIFAEIDKGGRGLRVVLHAASALEAGDEDEVKSLLPAVAAEAEGYKLLLQIAAALDDAEKAAPLVARAAEEKAPAWALGWTRAVSKDEKERREGLVELLFSDAPLARIVAERDLGIAGIAAGSEASERYAAFAHGRDCIRRFGAATVAELVLRARQGGAVAPRGGARR
ncbi:MAG: hypothetical protein U0359_40295 [Byssovorax sp.]